MPRSTKSIAKGYALAEKIAKELERTENGYQYFEEFWKGNYGHLNDFNKAIENFDSKQVLFQPQYDAIRKHAQERHKLGSLLLGAWLYLPESAVEAVQAYLKIGQFSFLDDALGMINEYHRRFFETLLDPQNQKQRFKAYRLAAKRLKKLKLQSTNGLTMRWSERLRAVTAAAAHRLRQPSTVAELGSLGVRSRILKRIPPKADAQELLDVLLPFAKQISQQHHEFYTSGGHMVADGTIAHLGATDGTAPSIRPHSFSSRSCCIEQPGYFVKCLLTDSAAVFFPSSIQHRDVKRDGVSYEDDYQGNALAATMVPGRIDIRFHQKYNDERVCTVCRNLLRSSEMGWAISFSVCYQGRTLIV